MIRIKYLLFSLVSVVGVGGALWFYGAFTQQGRRVPVLMYHSLSENPGHDVWTVDVAEFERHLKSLQEEGYTSILPRDLVSAVRWGRPLPRKPVIITFDDGLENVMRLGEPLLRAYGFTAILYVITGLPAKQDEPRTQYRGDNCLTWEEIREVAERGHIAIGSHSQSHSRDPAATANESWYSRRDLKEQAGIKTRDFCYPYGSHPAFLVEALQKANYRTAMICEDEVAVFSTGMDLFRIPRVSVYGGRHDYHIQRLPGTPQDDVITFQGENHGVAVPVHPVLVNGGQRYPYEGTLPGRLGGTFQTWSWDSSKLNGDTSEARVELWDAHLVLRLYP